MTGKEGATKYDVDLAIFTVLYGFPNIALCLCVFTLTVSLFPWSLGLSLTHSHSWPNYIQTIVELLPPLNVLPHHYVQINQFSVPTWYWNTSDYYKIDKLQTEGKEASYSVNYLHSGQNKGDQSVNTGSDSGFLSWFLPWLPQRVLRF